MLSAAVQLFGCVCKTQCSWKWRSLRPFMQADFPASTKSAHKNGPVNCSCAYGITESPNRSKFRRIWRLFFVWEAVKALPDKYREVIHLFYQEGYQTNQIARILHMNESTVRSNLSRGREKLRSMLWEAYDCE